MGTTTTTTTLISPTPTESIQLEPSSRHWTLQTPRTLAPLPAAHKGHRLVTSTHRHPAISTDNDLPPRDAVDAVPNGGYGWTIVATCSLMNFWTNGWITAWGVLQAAILSRSSSTHPISTRTITFVGSLALSLMVAFGLVSMRLIHMFGSRSVSVAGILLMSVGAILASSTIGSVAGLFGTAGVMVGLGSSILYTSSNVLPVQYFGSKLGTANGLIKMGGGLGATVIAISAQGMIDKIGVEWTFRVFGLLMLATGLPCAVLMKERVGRNGEGKSFIDWHVLRNNVPLICTCLAGVVCTFALYVPPFFLPLFAKSIGLSAGTGAALVAGFGLSTTLGRILAGVACDRMGSLNTLVVTMALNAVSMLAIWPVSSTLAPLIVFAAINGMANGAFFVALPTAVAVMVGPGLAPVAMGMATTGWTIGYLCGGPIAASLINARSAVSSNSIEPYRAAIFYAGGVALLGGIFVVVARCKLDSRVMKKL